MRYLNQIRGWSNVTKATVAILLVAFSLMVVPAYAAGKVIIRDSGLFSTAGGSITSSGAGWAVRGPLSTSSTLDTGAITCGSVTPKSDMASAFGASNKRFTTGYMDTLKVSRGIYGTDIDREGSGTLNIGRYAATLVQIGPMVNFTRTIKINESSNGAAGVATLSSGWVTVANNMVDANTRVIVSGQSTSGAPFVKSRSNNVSFDIYSTDGADTGVVYWELRKN